MFECLIREKKMDDKLFFLYDFFILTKKIDIRKSESLKCERAKLENGVVMSMKEGMRSVALSPCHYPKDM